MRVETAVASSDSLLKGWGTGIGGLIPGQNGFTAFVRAAFDLDE